MFYFVLLSYSLIYFDFLLHYTNSNLSFITSIYLNVLLYLFTFHLFYLYFVIYIMYLFLL